MPDFPSPEWVAAADAALTADASLSGSLGGATFRVGYAVEGHVAIDYRLEVDAGRARLLVGLDDAPLVLRADVGTARDIHDGRLSAQDAVINGDLRIEGDASELISHRAALDSINRVIDGVRADASADAPTDA